MVIINDATNNAKRSKKKRLSRKKKKHWRKNIDLTDVEEALEDQRLELRTGGLVSSKKDEDLFVLGMPDNSFSGDSKNDNRLSVDKIIVPNPNAVKQPKPQSKIDSKFQKVQRIKQLRRLQHKLNAGKPREAKNEFETGYDIWNKTAADLKQKVFQKSDVKCFTDVLMNTVTEKIPVGIGKSDGKKTAVEVAHPGASYNPTFNAHQELLSQENNKEISRHDEIKKVEKHLKVDRKDVVSAEQAFSEMQEGLFNDDTEKESDNRSDDNSDEDILEDVKPFKLKSKRQNRHEKQLERQRFRKAIQKKRNKELNSLKQLVAKIQETQAKKNDKKPKEKPVSKQPRLSSAKYVEPDEVIKLSNEIQGSLRRLKPEGSIMLDRFKSFQKRCLIEPLAKPKRKKSKLKKYKMFEKHSFKKITL